MLSIQLYLGCLRVQLGEVQSPAELRYSWNRPPESSAPPRSSHVVVAAGRRDRLAGGSCG